MSAADGNPAAGVALVLTMSLLLSGCLNPVPDIPHGKLLRGYVSWSFGLDYEGPGMGDGRWVADIGLGTDLVNRNITNPSRYSCTFSVTLVVDSLANSSVYQNLSAMADEDHHIKGAYLEFRGRTIDYDFNHEVVELWVLERLEPPPAGDEWVEEYCRALGYGGDQPETT